MIGFAVPIVIVVVPVQVYVFGRKEVAAELFDPVLRPMHPLHFAGMGIARDRPRGDRRAAAFLRHGRLIENGGIITRMEILVRLDEEVIGEESTAVAQQHHEDGLCRRSGFALQLEGQQPRAQAERDDQQQHDRQVRNVGALVHG